MSVALLEFVIFEIMHSFSDLRERHKRCQFALCRTWHVLCLPHGYSSDRLSPPQQALQFLKQGAFKLGPEWDKAHAICQTAEGTFEYDLVHALAHWIEGDMGNP